MAKKVIGIILIVLGLLGIVCSLCTLLFCFIFGGVTGALSSGSSLKASDGGTVLTTTGMVSDIDDNHTSVQYYVDGYTYEGTVNATTSSYEVFDEIEVEYDSENPASFAVPALYDWTGFAFGSSIVMGIVSVISIVIGIVMIVVGIILIRKAKKVRNAMA